MKNIIKFSLLLSTIFTFNCTPEKEQVLQISGKTIGVDTKTIFLVKPNQDPRFDSIIEIPVIDKTFYYETKVPYPEAVNLFLSKNFGSYMPLFLENEKIELEIYPEDEFDKNIVNGGKLNAEYKKYKRISDLKFNKRFQPLEDSLKILGKKYNDVTLEINTLNTKLEKEKNKVEKNEIQSKINSLKKEEQDLMVLSKSYNKKSEAVYFDQKLYQQEYMKSNNTIISYYFLIGDLMSYINYRDYFNKETIDINVAKNTFEVLRKNFPNHPYNELASNLIDAIEKVKVGKKYINFSAPDLNGNEVKLSNEITGKVALLDLWATWCGPCIKKSRTMVPLYNEYKDKGFTVIGVAGEFKNTERLVKFLKKEKWEWLNLVELDRQNNIWQKYGVDGGGGGLFLIDENGIILAKNPTKEEIKKELETRLN